DVQAGRHMRLRGAGFDRRRLIVAHDAGELLVGRVRSVFVDAAVAVVIDAVGRILVESFVVVVVHVGLAVGVVRVTLVDVILGRGGSRAPFGRRADAPAPAGIDCRGIDRTDPKPDV